MFGRTYRNCVRAEDVERLEEEERRSSYGRSPHNFNVSLDSQHATTINSWKSLEDFQKWNLDQVTKLARYLKDKKNYSFDFTFHDRVYQDLKKFVEVVENNQKYSHYGDYVEIQEFPKNNIFSKIFHDVAIGRDRCPGRPETSSMGRTWDSFYDYNWQIRGTCIGRFEIRYVFDVDGSDYRKDRHKYGFVNTLEVLRDELQNLEKIRKYYPWTKKNLPTIQKALGIFEKKELKQMKIRIKKNFLKEGKLDSYSNKWKLWKSLDDVEKWNLSQVPALAKYNKGQGNFDFNFYDKVYRDLKQIIELAESKKTGEEETERWWKGRGHQNLYKYEIPIDNIFGQLFLGLWGGVGYKNFKQPYTHVDRERPVSMWIYEWEPWGFVGIEKYSGAGIQPMRDMLYLDKALPRLKEIVKNMESLRKHYPWSKRNLPNIQKHLGIYEKKDPKKGTGKKPKGSGRRLYTDEDPSDTVSVKFSTVQDIKDTFSKASFKSKSHKRQSQIINLVHQRVRAAYQNAKDPDVKKRLKKAFDYAKKRKEASKKKTQSMKKDK